MIRIIRHELLLIMREPRFWIPFLVPPVFLVCMQIILAARYGGTVSEVFQPSLLLIVGALMSTMSVTLTADSFAGERERNTLELLLCLPIGVYRLFFGKLLSVLPLPIFLAMVSQATLWKLGANQDFSLLVKAWLYSISVCLVVSGVSLLISLFAQTVRSAAQANVLFVLVILMATQILTDRFFSSPWGAWLVFPCALLLFGLLLYFSLRRFSRLH